MTSSDDRPQLQWRLPRESPLAAAELDPLIALGIDELPDGALLVFDRELRYRLARGTALRDNGMIPAQVEGRHCREAMAADRWVIYGPAYEAALRGRATSMELSAPDGERRYLVRTKPITLAGEVIGGVSVATDITELRRTQQALAASERILRLTFDSAPVGMAMLSLDREFLRVNRALCHMLDRSPQWLLEHRLADVLAPEFDEPDLAARSRLLAGEAEVSDLEKQMLRADGKPIWVLHSIGLLRDADGASLHYISQFIDITEARSAREQLRYAATHDHLTGVFDRGGFWERANRVLGHAGRGHGKLAVLFMDLDRFKEVNDTHGHQAGDQALRRIAARIRARLRADDLVARWGGDEFVALLPSLRTLEDALSLTAELHKAVAEPIELADGGSVTLTMSVGLALVDAGVSTDQATSLADEAVYRAKALGGGQTVIAGAA